jgi:hypothetical protein
MRLHTLASARRLLLILRDTEAGAVLGLRLPWHAAGLMADAMTGQLVRQLQFDGEPLSRWDLDVPADAELLIVALHAR